ncbi:MAG: antibiotic biosynthesis monooxygenase [Pseudomonadota bacterium]
MVVVRIIMNVLPEKQLEVTQTLLSMIEPTTKEAGCLSYAVFCDIEDPNRYSLIQEWENRGDLDHYFASHRFGILLGTKALLSENLTIQIQTVLRTEGLDAVEAIRKRISRN